MNEAVVKTLEITYSVCLPLVLAYIVNRINRIKNDKIKSNKYVEDSFKTLFDRLTDMDTKIKNQSAKIDKLDKRIEFKDAMTCRYRIIRAADEIRNGSELSEEHLEQLGEDIEIYKNYCKAHPDYTNHKGQKSMQLVLDYEDRILNGK